MNKKLRIGVVGFSRSQFDQKMAIIILRNIFEKLTKGKNLSEFEIVSGYTNAGVPRLAYRIADEMGIETVGFSARQALRVRSGVYPVKKEILVGERFGEESEKFIEYIDLLVRVGGGSQSRKEVEMFKKYHAGKDLSKLLFEEEVMWFGK